MGGSPQTNPHHFQGGFFNQSRERSNSNSQAIINGVSGMGQVQPQIQGNQFIDQS